MKLFTYQQILERFYKAAKGAQKAGHKYVRRVPKPGGGYRYFYSETSIARKVTEGERINLKHQGSHDVVEVKENGLVRLRDTRTGKHRTMHVNELHRHLHDAYRDAYLRGAERQAKRYLKKVKGIDPDAIAENPMGAWRQFGEKFKAAGVRRDDALALFRQIGQLRGWGSNAKAVMVALAADKKLGKFVVQSRTQIARGAANLARAEQKSLNMGEPFRLAPVQAKHVVAAVTTRSKKGESAGEHTEKLRREAAVELARLEAMLQALEVVGPSAPEALKHYATAALKSTALAELATAATAYPGLADADELKRLRELEGRYHAVTAKPDADDGGIGKPGASTTVYIADVTGAPTPQKAKYRLVEAGDIKASHNPRKGFKKTEGYPDGLQERVYHESVKEQNKVRRNAERLLPDLVVNTNPDAANGPPLITKDGIVLGGNSRTMSLELVHAKGGDRRTAYMDQLKRDAHHFGFTPADVDGMKSPILVREVEADAGSTNPGELKELVRRYNEVFTQSMDPRTDQVARAQRVSQNMLNTLAAGMTRPDGSDKHATLNAFLSSSDAATFIDQLQRSGIIDSRNYDQYMRKKTPGATGEQLNEDGKRLVERLLVGRMVPDPDTLSDVQDSQMKALARSSPHMARAGRVGHDLNKHLRQALNAQRYMRLAELQTMKQWDGKLELGNQAQATGSGMPTKPKISPEARHLLEVIHKYKGQPVNMSKWFREFAQHAEANPAGQGGLFGAGKPLERLLGEVVRGEHISPEEKKRREEKATKRQKKAAGFSLAKAGAMVGQVVHGVESSGSFAPMVAQDLEGAKPPGKGWEKVGKRWRRRKPGGGWEYWTAKAQLSLPMGSGWQSIPGGKKGGKRRRTGRGWEYWYPTQGGAKAAGVPAVEDLVAAAVAQHGADAVKAAVRELAAKAAAHADQQMQAKAPEAAKRGPVRRIIDRVFGRKKTATQADVQEVGDAIKRDPAAMKIARAGAQEVADSTLKVVSRGAKAREVARVAAKAAAGPFLFGFVDNFILYMAGAGIDASLASLGIGAAAVAGLGNAVSDAVGQAASDRLDALVEKMGGDEARTETLSEKTKKRIGAVASVAGIFAGAIVGMVPLLFGVSFGKGGGGDMRKGEEKKAEKALTFLELVKARKLGRKPAPGQLGLFGERVHDPNKPPGTGWQRIPGGRKGGYRKRSGTGWSYWYPDKRTTRKTPQGVRQQLEQMSERQVAQFHYEHERMRASGEGALPIGPPATEEFNRRRDEFAAKYRDLSPGNFAAAWARIDAAKRPIAAAAAKLVGEQMHQATGWDEVETREIGPSKPTPKQMQRSRVDAKAQEVAALLDAISPYKASPKRMDIEDGIEMATDGALPVEPGWAHQGGLTDADLTEAEEVLDVALAMLKKPKPEAKKYKKVDPMRLRDIPVGGIIEMPGSGWGWKRVEDARLKGREYPGWVPVQKVGDGFVDRLDSQKHKSGFEMKREVVNTMRDTPNQAYVTTDMPDPKAPKGTGPTHAELYRKVQRQQDKPAWPTDTADMAAMRALQVGDTVSLKFPKVRGATKRTWMGDEAHEYRVTGPVTVSRDGPGVFTVELEPTTEKRPRARLYVRPDYETERFRVLLHLYGRDGRGVTTGHPAVIAEPVAKAWTFPAARKYEAQYRKYLEGAGRFPKSRGRSGLSSEEMKAIIAKVDAERTAPTRKAYTFTSILKAVQFGLFGERTHVETEPQGRQRTLFGGPDEPTGKKKTKKKPTVFIGPKGGKYLDPKHTVSASHRNPHGGHLKPGKLVKEKDGTIHEVKAVGSHHKTGRVGVLVHTPKGHKVLHADEVSLHLPRVGGQRSLF